MMEEMINPFEDKLIVEMASLRAQLAEAKGALINEKRRGDEWFDKFKAAAIKLNQTQAKLAALEAHWHIPGTDSVYLGDGEIVEIEYYDDCKERQFGFCIHEEADGLNGALIPVIQWYMFDLELAPIPLDKYPRRWRKIPAPPKEEE